MKIICVNGFARSGKDSFCNYAFYNRGMVYPYSTIDEIKLIATRLGWDGVKDAKGRKLLSDLKDCLTAYNDIPTQHLLKQMKARLSIFKYEEAKDVIFLVQMREPEEINRWKKEFGARSLLISRPNVETEWGNHADDNVLQANYDYYLINTEGLDEWEDQAIAFIDRIRKEDWESHI